MRLRVAGAMLMLLAGIAAAPAPAPAQESKGFVDIGCMYPMTGRGALYGRDSIAAIEMAMDEINSAGGVVGYQLRVVHADSQSKPAFAVSIARRFITDRKVHFLCGVVSSSVGLAVSEVAREHKTIFIGTDHASSRLTVENAHPYYFRVSNNAYQSMAAGAIWLAEAQKKRGWKTIAFIGPDYEYGRGMWADLRSKLDEMGVKYQVIGDLWPKLYEPDYALYIAELKRLKPDVIVNGHWGGDFVAFVRQGKALGLFGSSIFANFDAGGNYEVLAALEGDMPLGLVLSARHHVNWPDTERNRAFVEDFQRRTGHYPSYAAEGAYAGMKAIAKAVATVGNPNDTDALIKTLEGMKLQLPEDPPGFCSRIDPVTHQIVQMQAIGTVVEDDRYPPAKAMLGQFEVYEADRLVPSKEEIERRRAAAGRSTSLQSPPVP